MKNTQSITELTQEQRAEFEKTQSMWKIVFSQFISHKLAVISSVIISIFILIALFAPVIEKVTGISPSDQNVFNRYMPSMSQANAPQDSRESRVEQFYVIHESGAETLAETLAAANLIEGVAAADILYEIVTLEPTEALAKLGSLPSETPLLADYKKMIQQFSTFHILGTDELGRDVFMRLVYGTRVSIGVGVLVALASALIGLIIGSLAGYYGGFIDSALMRVTDALLSLPTLPILIVVAAIDLDKLPAVRYIISKEDESIYKLVFILCMFSWMTVARLVRGSILSLREREFILAAKTLGAKNFSVITTHMIPNVVAPLLVSVTLGVGESILFEAALSFLGLGIQPPTPSWGNMLFNAQELIYQAPLLAVIPGLLILLTTVSFNYLGDGLQDAIDPKAIRR